MAEMSNLTDAVSGWEGGESRAMSLCKMKLILSDWDYIKSTFKVYLTDSLSLSLSLSLYIFCYFRLSLCALIFCLYKKYFNTNVFPFICPFIYNDTQVGSIVSGFEDFYYMHYFSVPCEGGSLHKADIMTFFSCCEM